MGIDIKAIFGYGIVLDYKRTPWIEESFEEFDCDFLEYVSQQTEYLPPGEIFDADPEQREQFASTLPVMFIKAGNSREYYLLLTKYCWLLEKPKAMKVSLNLEDFGTELAKAKEFCKKTRVDFDSTDWLLGIMFD
ncbi:hypothetical protein [Aliterella atlantica]|uniref:Uncharacterized protein n=1 Tax=Aliterella atlantica CENA595 TaxID=1618023 RepID=A0A0D8ZN71_9CYAN|nr:hypothetical protein [Aliterella atlantica]KJH69797.1 hypothetical protein UH38_22060 [Aliterella atlantica CENA595]